MPLDISTIPPPDSIDDVSYEFHVNRMIELLKTLNNQFTTVKESDPAYGLLEVFGYEITNKVQEINDRVRSVMLITATGADLDNLAVIYGEKRRVISEGDENVNPPIPEVLESDRDFRTRLLSAFRALALGSREWYKKLVIESGSPFEETVKDLQVLGPEDSTDDLTIPNGEVWCYIEAVSDTNPIPDSSLIDDVLNYLDKNTLPDGTKPRLKSEERRFIGDTIKVYACIQKPYTISASLTIAAGLNEDTVKETIEELALEFANQYKRIGEKIPISAIYSALDTEDILELDLHYPTVNIEPLLNELPIVSPTFDLDAKDYVSGITWNNFSDQTGAKWSMIEENSIWYIVFSNDISDDDKRKLRGVGEGRKFDIISGSGDDAEIQISGQVTSVLGESDDNSNNENHFFLKLSEEPTLTGVTSGDELYVSFKSGIDII